MSYPGQRRFRIDLGVAHVPQPCDRHKTDGYDGDCDECAATPDRELPVPHLAGHFVEVRNPDLLPYGEKKRLFAPSPGPSERPTGAERIAQAEALQARRERIVAGLITAWDLVAVDEESGAVLPLPNSDPSALDRAPDIVNHVFAELMRAQRRPAQGVPVPPPPTTEQDAPALSAEENPDG